MKNYKTHHGDERCFHLSGGDIGITDVSDRQDTRAEVLTAGSAKVEVVARVVVDRGLGEHRVVLDLGLADWGAVVGNHDQLGATSAEGGQGLASAQDVLAGAHDELDLGVDRVYLRLRLLGHLFTTPVKRIRM
jgi:hypothetical protein